MAKATRTHRMDTDGHILATKQDTPPAARFGHSWKPSQGTRAWQEECHSNMWEDKTRGCVKSLLIPIYPKGQERHRSRLIIPPPWKKPDKATLFVNHLRISSSRKISFEADPRDLEGIKSSVYFHNAGE